MDWNTIYITGTSNFWDEVNKKLSQSGLKYLAGTLEQEADNKFIGLYWLDASEDLSTLKSAIGDKIISKWNLCFGNEWDQINVGKSANPKGFTSEELNMIRSIRLKVRHSI